MLNAIGFTPSLHMARRRQNEDGNAAMGQRLRAVREAMGETLQSMARRLNVAATELGFPPAYEFWTVQRNEKGSLSFEDMAVWLAVAPAEMSLTWDLLAFGRKLPNRSEVVGTRDGSTRLSDQRVAEAERVTDERRSAENAKAAHGSKRGRKR